MPIVGVGNKLIMPYTNFVSLFTYLMHCLMLSCIILLLASNQGI